MQGTVRLYFLQKNYGIIEVERDQTFFFHATSIIGGAVRQGDPVTFELEDDPRRSDGRLMAVSVQKLESDPSAPDPTRLFFGNVAFTTTETELRDLFEKCGRVEDIRLCRGHESGQSRGFGFVQMVDVRSALNCIAKLHGAEVLGRRITVKLATERRQISPHGDPS